MAQLDALAQLLGINQNAEAQMADKPGLSPIAAQLFNLQQPKPGPALMPAAQALKNKMADTKAKQSKPVAAKSSGPVADMVARPASSVLAPTEADKALEARIKAIQDNFTAGRVGNLDKTLETDATNKINLYKAKDPEEWDKMVNLMRTSIGYDPDTGRQQKGAGLPTYGHLIDSIVNMQKSSGDTRRVVDEMEADKMSQVDINPVLQLLEQNTKIKSPKISPKWGPTDIIAGRAKQGDMEATLGALREKLLGEEIGLLKTAGHQAGQNVFNIGSKENPTPQLKTGSGGSGPKINPNKYAGWAAGMGQPVNDYFKMRDLLGEVNAMKAAGQSIPGVGRINNLKPAMLQDEQEQRLWQILQAGVNAAGYAKSGQAITGNEMTRLKREYGIAPGQTEEAFMQGLKKLVSDFEYQVAAHRALLPDAMERNVYNSAAGVDLEGIAQNIRPQAGPSSASSGKPAGQSNLLDQLRARKQELRAKRKP